jgi:hypothetical protein
MNKYEWARASIRWINEYKENMKPTDKIADRRGKSVDLLRLLLENCPKHKV